MDMFDAIISLDRFLLRGGSKYNPIIAKSDHFAGPEICFLSVQFWTFVCSAYVMGLFAQIEPNPTIDIICGIIMGMCAGTTIIRIIVMMFFWSLGGGDR